MTQPQYALISGSASPPPQFVERQPNRGAVEPSRGRVSLGLRRSPQLPKSVDREFLGAARLDDDSGDNASNPRIVLEEHRLEIE